MTYVHKVKANVTSHARTFTQDAVAVETRVTATSVRAFRVVAVSILVAAVRALRLTVILCQSNQSNSDVTRGSALQ